MATSRTIVLLWVLCGTNFLSYANPLEERFGLGARVKAMGGVGITQAEDFSATYYNPANLAFCSKNLISLGYQYLATDFHASGQEAMRPEQLGFNHIGLLGACLKLPLNIAMGVYGSFGAVGPMSLQFRTLDSKVRLPLYDHSLKPPSGGLGVGYRPLKWVSVGVAASMTVHADFHQRIVLPLPPNQEKMEVDVSGLVRPTLSFVGGISAEPVENLRLAAVFRGPRYSKFEDVANTHLAGALVSDVKQNLEGSFGFSPMQVGGGLSYSFLDITLASELTWYRWSQYEGPFLRISPAEDSKLSQIINYPAQENYGFSDIVVPRLGAEYVWRKILSARAGYGYRLSPAPKPAGRANLVDGGAHMISAGGGYRLILEKITFDADVFFTGHLMPQMRMTNYSFGGWAYDTGLSLTIEY